MGGKRAQPVDGSTFEGRLRLAVLGAPYSAQEIAEACGRASAQSIYDWWNPKASGSPNPEQIGVIARMTGRTLDWLIDGRDEAQPESDWLRHMRLYEQRLSPARQRELARMAEVMVSEDEAFRSRLRASGLDEETIDLVLRAAPSPERDPGAEDD